MSRGFFCGKEKKTRPAGASRTRRRNANRGDARPLALFSAAGVRAPCWANLHSFARRAGTGKVLAEPANNESNHYPPSRRQRDALAQMLNEDIKSVAATCVQEASSNEADHG